jgi:hypothetical protein
MVMDKRTRILGGLFGVAIAYAFVANVVYPHWIEPLVHIGDHIAEAQELHDELKGLQADLAESAGEYRHMVGRIGGFEVGKVETDVRARLNDLVDRYKLQDVNVTPSRPTEDRKTGITRMQITLNAAGKLDAAVHMLREVSEFPHVLRVGSVSLSPASSSGRSQGPQLYNVRIPLELVILPQQRIVGKIEPEQIRQPERYVRHADANYAVIWERKPFTEPIPLVAQAGKDISVKVGQRATLTASASGGEPPYTMQWAPSDRLDDPTSQKPGVDTSSGLNQSYTLTVTDSEGGTATASVRVTVVEPPKPEDKVVVDVPKPPAPPPGPQRWAHRQYLQVRMTLLRSAGTQTVGELMLFNNQSKSTEYYTINDDFDGGKLAYVHPLGGIVHRSDEYFLLPIGHWLDRDIIAANASKDDFPELLAIIERLKQNAITAQHPAEETELSANTAAARADTEGQPDAEAALRAASGRSPTITPADDPSNAATPTRALDPSQVPGAKPLRQTGARPPKPPTAERAPRPTTAPPGSGGPNLQRSPSTLKTPNDAARDRARRGEGRLPTGSQEEAATGENEMKKKNPIDEFPREITKKRIRDYLKRRSEKSDPD